MYTVSQKTRHQTLHQILTDFETFLLENSVVNLQKKLMFKYWLDIAVMCTKPDNKWIMILMY